MAAPKGNKYALGNSGKPPMYSSPEDLANKINEYFEYCVEQQEKVTITGLALYLGFCSRRSFYYYKEKEEFQEVINDSISKINPKSRKRLFDYQGASDTKSRIIERRKLDPEYRIRLNFASLLRYHLKNKNRSKTFDLVGYNVNELMSHLESMFRNGMTWENYGAYWHIDHVIPASYFKYSNSTEIQFKECWSLNNLQPLLVAENLKKSDSLIYLNNNGETTEK